ncbi:M15 family metallopeptidase [Desulfovibrio aminophilus]|nr:M15 family metallopeptidase [Desulfovibrio aminophilus]MCM0754860.1 M15 family metallopeptidase [Desulfovibrio aminophilus]
MRRLLAALFLLAFLVPAAPAFSDAGEDLARAGFVEPSTLDPSLVLDMRYAGTNNFSGQAVYPSARCFLRADVAKRLLAAQAELRKQGLGLKLFDCYRPFHVQERFWAIVPDERYVARPEKKDGVIVQGSKHNRGAAVDVGLVDSKGRELPMPSGFDDFTEKAHRDYRGASAEALSNRAVLERAMSAQGFEPLPTEWWHFDGPGWQGYEMLDLPLP